MCAQLYQVPADVCRKPAESLCFASRSPKSVNGQSPLFLLSLSVVTGSFGTKDGHSVPLLRRHQRLSFASRWMQNGATVQRTKGGKEALGLQAPFLLRSWPVSAPRTPRTNGCYFRGERAHPQPWWGCVRRSSSAGMHHPQEHLGGDVSAGASLGTSLLDPRCSL